MKRNAFSLGLALTALGVVLVVGGCRTSSASSVVSVHGKEIQENSRVLARWIKVQQVSERRNDGHLVARVTVENLKARDCQFEYRFQWLDHAGMPMDTVEPVYNQFSLAAYQKTNLKGISPVKGAVDFIFDVRFRAGSTRW